MSNSETPRTISLAVEGTSPKEKITNQLDRAIIPVLVFIQQKFEDAEPEEKRVLFYLYGKIGGREGTKRAMGLVAASLVCRISYLVPLEEFNEIFYGPSFAGLKEKKIGQLTGRETTVLSRKLASFLGGKKETLEEIRRSLDQPVSRVGIRQLKVRAVRKICTRMSASIKTPTGERPVGEILEENLGVISEEVETSGLIAEYPQAPNEIWEAARFLALASDENLDILRELRAISLQAPLDFLFSKEVLIPLLRDISQGTSSHSELVKSAGNLLRQFRERWQEEMVAISAFRWPGPERPAAPGSRITSSWEPDREISLGIFRGSALVPNALKRGGIRNIRDLLACTPEGLMGLRHIGKGGLRIIYNFLEEEYPGERLTRELRKYLRILD